MTMTTHNPNTHTDIGMLYYILILFYRCLDKTGPHALQSSPLTCNKIILSTAVLHNMAMAHNVNMQDVDEREEPLPNTQPQVQIYGGDEDDYLLTKQGEEERQFLVQNRFAQM